MSAQGIGLGLPGDTALSGWTPPLGGEAGTRGGRDDHILSKIGCVGLVCVAKSTTKILLSPIMPPTPSPTLRQTYETTSGYGQSCWGATLS